VPDSVESLGDIQEDCGGVLPGFKCFVGPIMMEYFHR
jgi:hypothetical protein